MVLERLTSERAQRLEAGDTLVSPYSSWPFAPLRITEIQTSPTGRTMVRTRAVAGKAGPWTLATNYWLPPQGYKWSQARHQWERTDTDGNHVRWQRPTMAELDAKETDV